jgi:hypothetical protein
LAGEIRYLTFTEGVEINKMVLKEKKVKKGDSHRVADRQKIVDVLRVVKESPSLSWYSRYNGSSSPAQPHLFRFIAPFMSRLSQLDVTNQGTLGIVMKYCPTRSLQEKALASAVFLSEVNWSSHDVIYTSYVIEDPPLSASL